VIVVDASVLANAIGDDEEAGRQARELLRVHRISLMLRRPTFSDGAGSLAPSATNDSSKPSRTSPTSRLSGSPPLG
jgi:hypothetical protein